MLVPEQHPLRFKKRFGLADIENLPLIEWPYCPLHQSFIRLLAERGIALQVQASAAREELLLHMVDAGMGLAVVPQSHAAQARRALTRPLDGPLAFSRHIGLACDASDAPLLGLLHRLADGMKATAAQPEPTQRSNVV
ncbi:LysR family transcriptional regulator substrate-binding protein [Acidovorax delafieldii]|uniref:LysR family transcriptional regulator substrate-binding protein n=2 Tax=Comamonadaceae TaxID=80864 RepID=UPI0037578563